MSVITEGDLRSLMQSGALSEHGNFYVDKSAILTPSAKSYLAEKGILMKYNTTEWNEHPSNDTNQQASQSASTTEKNAPSEVTQYETLFGGVLYEKPEHMTHLRGNVLVFKDHPRIALRGAIDTLESEIIVAQVTAQRLGKQKIVDDLEEVIRFIRKLLRCEVSGDPVGEFYLQGLNEHDLRDQSYHPSKYFGIKHFLPTVKHGEMVALLNRLRTLTRKTELIAYDAFKDQYGQVSREDIIQAFNRLSSLFWIMMFKELSGRYGT